MSATRQGAGRGRDGRSWTSEPGNLFASLLLIDPAPPARAPELGFVASLALAHALKGLIGAESAIRIKWPNDILCDGAKIAGLLLESASLAAPPQEGATQASLACVAGFGVNCASHPSDTLYPAGDLGAIAGRPVAPDVVLTALAKEMARWLAVWAQPGGFVLIRANWLELAAGLGETIRVARRSGDLDGVFRSIDDAGRLILETAAGEVPVDAGDVFLKPAPSRC